MKQKMSGRGRKDSRIALRKYIEVLPGGVMVEVGSCKGESTVLFAKKFKLVFAIDPWEGFYQYGDKKDQFLDAGMLKEERDFDKAVHGVSNIAKICSKSNLVVDKFDDKSLDFVYIDGCHTYESVREDISIWLPKIKPTGMIGGHDYNLKGWPLVVKAIHESFGKPPDIRMNGANWAYRKVEL